MLCTDLRRGVHVGKKWNCSYFSDHLPLWCALLDKWSRLQSSHRGDWVRRTGIKATHLLEHILLQDLSRYEDQPTAQVHCHLQAGGLSPLTDCWWPILRQSMGREKWKELIGTQASFQNNCNKEGFNVFCSQNQNSKVRIGIVSNGGTECDSCDSRIEFSTGGRPHNLNTCGNKAGVSPDNRYKHIKAMGYILVQ